MADVFEFDDELIERLEHDIDLDVCGALSDCRNETCACFLLGRDGEPIPVSQDRDGRWIVYLEGSSPRAVASVHATLADAVRAVRALMRAGE